MHRIYLSTLLLMVISVCQAQDWMKIHTQDATYDGTWTFPYSTSHFSHFDFTADEATIRLHRIDETDVATTFIPFSVDLVDSVIFADADDTTLKDKYKVFAINITIENFDTLTCYYNNPAFPGENGARQDWYNCYVSVDGRGQYPDYSGTARVRGRGNSSWRWYPKKPMKLKLDTKSKILGMGRNRDWVLLANYRDVTDLMNTYAFIAGKQMGLPYTSAIRYAEVFVNGEYKGLYQLAEQVEQGSHRVDVADDGGLLLTIDTDDGDDTWKYNTDSMCFWSKVYNLPIGIKYPDNVDKAGRDRIRNQFAILENTLKNGTYADLDTLLDIPTYIALMQLNDLVYNNDFPNRSIFLSRTPGGKWRFGPPWDYDAGYAFSGNQYTSHQFFSSVGNIKVSPASTRNYYNAMFRSGRFTKAYINQWNSYKDSLMTLCWDETMRYVEGMNEPNGLLSARSRDLMRWPMNDNYGSRDPEAETQKMQQWLTQRIDYLTRQINNFTIPSFDNDDGGNGDDPQTEPEYADYYGHPAGVCIDTLICVGNETFNIEYDMRQVASMSKQSIPLDIDKILGCFPADEHASVSMLTYMGYDNIKTRTLTSTRSSSDGFYMNFEGQVCVWQAAIMQCKVGYNTSGSNLTFAYTNSNTTSGSRCTASVFLVYANRYFYELKLDITLLRSEWGGWVW